MAKLVPDIENIKRLKLYQEEGELYLVDYLNRNLDDSYEVFFQPFLNGDRPDIIVMKQNVGAYIIEVKDWNLQYYTYRKTDKAWSGEFILNKNDAKVRSPFKQVKTYKDNLYDFYSTKLLAKNIFNSSTYGVIRCGVYFHKHPAEALKGYFDIDSMVYDYIDVWGADSDIAGDIKRWAQNISTYRTLFDDDIYNELLILLKQEFHYENEGQYLQFDKKQRRLCESFPGAQTKIKGVAGSGKSLIIAKRAVNAVKRTDSTVLILTYNITLRNYLRDRINSVRDNFSWDKFEISHFHLFISSKTGIPFRGDSLKSDKKRNDEYYNQVVEELKSTKDIEKYKAIFIDEGQDYDRRWFSIIKDYFLDEDGEFVIAADEKQNVYHRASIDSEKMVATNIKGRWNELNKSFRVSKEIAELAIKFQREFLMEKYNVDDIESADEQLGMNLGPKQEMMFCSMNKLDYKLIFESIVEYAKKNKIGYNEICILGRNTEGLRRLDFIVRNTYHLNTAVTFESQEEYNRVSLNNNNPEECSRKISKIRRSRKFNFHMNSGKLKISTIHSFKGWEIDTLVLVLDESLNQKDDELIYTAITRCRRNLVIYGLENSRYAEFFKKGCEKVMEI